MSFQIQFRGTFGGASSINGWAPAVTGTINQTGTPDEEASTFASREAAEDALEHVIRPELSEVDEVRDFAPTFRIVEVES